MKQLSLIFLLVLSLFLFFGCTQFPTCGDGLCNGTETSQTCSVDCGIAHELGNLQVNVFDANTGLPISGMEIGLQESLGEDCGLNLNSSNSVLFTDSTGSALAQLDAGKKYVAAVFTDDYYPVEYKCAEIYVEQTALIEYNLVKLPSKPLCEESDWTIAIGDSIDVNGINGALYKVSLNDYLLGAVVDDYNWAQMYEAQWSLSDYNNTLDYVQSLPPLNLGTAFENYPFFAVYFIKTCWQEGNDIPFAVIDFN